MLWGGGRLEVKAMKSLMPQSGFPGDLAFPVWASPEMLRLPEVPGGLPDEAADSPAPWSPRIPASQLPSPALVTMGNASSATSPFLHVRPGTVLAPTSH